MSKQIPTKEEEEEWMKTAIVYKQIKAKTRFWTQLTMIVRIFLPDRLHSLKSINCSKCNLIFGKIECNSDGNVSIFIVNTKETGRIEDPSQQQAIGCILPDNETFEKQSPDSDFIEFCSSSNSSTSKESTLHLKTLHLPNFISADQSIQIQMFLYNFQTFTDLAQRIDESTWCQRPDAIAQLLILIKNNEWQTCMMSTECNLNDGQKTTLSNQNRFTSFLMTVSLFVQSYLSFLNSAFVRHFHFWTANIEKLPQNR